MSRMALSKITPEEEEEFEDAEEEDFEDEEPDMEEPRGNPLDAFTVNLTEKAAAGKIDPR